MWRLSAFCFYVQQLLCGARYTPSPAFDTNVRRTILRSQTFTRPLQQQIRRLNNDTFLGRPSLTGASLRIAQLEMQLASALEQTPCNSSKANDHIGTATSGSNEVNGMSGINDADAFPPEATVFVTFVNGDEKYRELMINWALHLRALRVWHVVVAFDETAAASCRENGIPHIRYASDMGWSDANP